MARTAKKTKTVTVATVEDAAAEAENRCVGEVAADVVAALLAPEAETAMTTKAEAVADAASVAADTVSATQSEVVASEAATGREVLIPLNKLKKSPRNARKTPHSEETVENRCGRTRNHRAGRYCGGCGGTCHHGTGSIGGCRTRCGGSHGDRRGRLCRTGGSARRG